MAQAHGRADARLNHARLIATAVAVFAERGGAAEMKDIAERAGVGIGTIYRHFPSKDDLILAVMADATEQFESALATALREADPVRAIRLVIRDALTITERYGRLFDIDVADHPGELHSAADLILRQQTNRDLLTSLVTRGIREGRFRRDLDPLAAVAVIGAAFSPWFLDEWRTTRTSDQVADALLTIFLHGAMARSAAS